MTLQIQCPVCSTTFALREARNDQAWRDFVTLLMQIPAAVQQPLLRKAGEVMATQMQPQAITDAAHKLYVPEKLPEMSEEQAAANRRRVSEMLNNALKGVAP